MSADKPTNKGGQSSGGARASSASDSQATSSVPVEPRSKKKTAKKKTRTASAGAVKGAPATVKKAAGRKSTAKKNAAADAQITSTMTSTETQSENNRPGNGLAWLAILGSLLALGLSGYAAFQSTLSQELNTAKLSALDERLAFVSTEQKGLVSGVSALEQKSTSGDDAQLILFRDLEQAQNTLQSTVAGIELASTASTEDIKANLGKNVARWKLDEVHSLLSRVNQFYQLTGDKVRAEAGLKLANATLSTIDNPHLAAVKAALAEDLLRIQSDVNVDTGAITARLLALSALIPDMKLVGDSLNIADAAPPETDVAEQADGGFVEAGRSLLGDLSSLVKYKNLDAPLRPSLDGSERFVLYELLQLKVQTAMVALMRHNNPVFQSQLQLANEEINAFFDLEQTQTQTVLKELKALGAEDVSLSVEPVSGALSSLSEVMILEN